MHSTMMKEAAEVIEAAMGSGTGMHFKFLVVSQLLD